MTQADREAFAARLQLELRVRFQGIAKDAYSAAGVNPATWANAIEGRPIKPRSLIRIVANLWPETQGDWTQIPEVNTFDQARSVALERRVRELERIIAERLGQTPGA